MNIIAMTTFDKSLLIL